MDRVSNLLTYFTCKVNTGIKNGCKETILRIYFSSRRTPCIAGLVKLSTLVQLYSKNVFSQSNKDPKYYSCVHTGLFSIQLK